MHALVISYSLRGATPGEHAELCEQLAPAVAAVRGLTSTTWLTNPAAGRYGPFFFSKRSRTSTASSPVNSSRRSHRTARSTALWRPTTQLATGRPRGRVGSPVRRTPTLELRIARLAGLVAR